MHLEDKFWVLVLIGGGSTVTIAEKRKDSQDSS
jgi:hypothetical protein